MWEPSAQNLTTYMSLISIGLTKGRSQQRKNGYNNRIHIILTPNSIRWHCVPSMINPDNFIKCHNRTSSRRQWYRTENRHISASTEDMYGRKHHLARKRWKKRKEFVQVPSRGIVQWKGISKLIGKFTWHPLCGALNCECHLSFTQHDSFSKECLAGKTNYLCI